MQYQVQSTKIKIAQDKTHIVGLVVDDAESHQESHRLTCQMKMTITPSTYLLIGLNRFQIHIQCFCLSKLNSIQHPTFYSISCMSKSN